MHLAFTKQAGKYDALVVTRPGRAPERIDCPKQGIIPHDMVHYAVESILAHRGFLSHVADGAAPAFAMAAGASEEAVERLVETFQAELWGGEVPAADLLATYAHAPTRAATPPRRYRRKTSPRSAPASPISPRDGATCRSAARSRWTSEPSLELALLAPDASS